MKNNKLNIDDYRVRSISTTVGVEARSSLDDNVEPSRVISGYAARFNEWSKPFWDEWVEKIDIKAFVGCEMSDVVMCVDHSTACADVLARSRDGAGTLEITIDEVGVKFRFELPHTTIGDDVLELVQRGDISECSFKFRVAEEEWAWRNKNTTQKYDERTITKIARLFDLSLVVTPQYFNTSAVTERVAVDGLRPPQILANIDVFEVEKARNFVNKSNINH